MRARLFGLFVLAVLLLPVQAQGAPVRGQPGDLWADVVLGQPDFGMLTPTVTARQSPTPLQARRGKTIRPCRGNGRWPKRGK